MNNPLISVIVPVYNVEKYINNCINSVINQTYRNWELILVDDGSPDNSPQICDDYAEKDKRIRVIHKKNGGVSSARNVALDQMKGDYVTFLDGDDFFNSNFLKILLDLCVNKDADISQCGSIRGCDNSFPYINKKYRTNIYNNTSIFTSFSANIVVWGKLYKREIFNEIRMPIGKYFEDDFTTWKCYYSASKIVVVDIPLYYYTQNSESTMHQHARKVNLSYFDAYDERISFFIDKKEKIMEEMSRFQFCKALLLTWGNENMTNDQRIAVGKMFKINWLNIKKSKYVPVKFKCLFRMFSIFPKFTLKLVNFLHK